MLAEKRIHESTMGMTDMSHRSRFNTSELREASKSLIQQPSSFSILSSNANITQTDKESKRLEDLKNHLRTVKEPLHIVIKSKPRRRGIDSQRGSKYRGVSKNGKKWQVSLLLYFSKFNA